MSQKLTQAPNHVPTFVLKKIEVMKLIADYNLSKYSNISLENIPNTKIKLGNNAPMVAPVYGANSEEALWTFRDRYNINLLIASSNQKNFEFFIKSGGELPNGGRCEWCRMDFKHKAIGIPIAFKEDLITFTDSITQESKTEKKMIFWTEGIFCDFECALAHLYIYIKLPMGKSDSHYLNSESALKLMYKLVYPESDDLKEAPDYRLLNINGGSLTPEEFKDKRHIWVRTNHLVIPAKFSYMKFGI